MYSLEIGGHWCGNFSTVAEAMAEVGRSAIPFYRRWKIYTAFGDVYAEG